LYSVQGVGISDPFSLIERYSAYV